MKNVVQKSVLLVTSLVTAMSPYTANALHPSREEEFAEYGIMFYDPDAVEGSCSSPGYIGGSIPSISGGGSIWTTDLEGPHNVEDFVVEVLRAVAAKANLPESSVVTEQHVLALTAFAQGEGGNIANGWIYNLWNTGRRDSGLVIVDSNGNQISGNANGTHGYQTFEMGVEATARTMTGSTQNRLVTVLSDPNSTAEDFMYTLTHFEDYSGNAIWAEASDDDPHDGRGDESYYRERLGLIATARARYSEIASQMMGPPGYTSGNRGHQRYTALTRPLRYQFDDVSGVPMVNLPSSSSGCPQTSITPGGTIVIGNGEVVIGNYGGYEYAFPVVNGSPRSNYKCENEQTTSCNHGDRDAADIFQQPGAPIVAVTNGVLKNVRVAIDSPKAQERCASSGEPNRDTRRDTLQLWGDDGYIYFYTHMTPGSTQQAGISTGMRVTAGTPVGTVGPRGADNCSIPHLHISATPQSAPSSVDNYDGVWLWKTLLPSLP